MKVMTTMKVVFQAYQTYQAPNSGNMKIRRRQTWSKEMACLDGSLSNQVLQTKPQKER